MMIAEIGCTRHRQVSQPPWYNYTMACFKTTSLTSILISCACWTKHANSFKVFERKWLLKTMRAWGTKGIKLSWWNLPVKFDCNRLSGIEDASTFVEHDRQTNRVIPIIPSWRGLVGLQWTCEAVRWCISDREIKPHWRWRRKHTHTQSNNNNNNTHKNAFFIEEENKKEKRNACFFVFGLVFCFVCCCCCF